MFTSNAAIHASAFFGSLTTNMTERKNPFAKKYEQNKTSKKTVKAATAAITGQGGFSGFLTGVIRDTIVKNDTNGQLRNLAKLKRDLTGTDIGKGIVDMLETAMNPLKAMEDQIDIEVAERKARKEQKRAEKEEKIMKKAAKVADEVIDSMENMSAKQRARIAELLQKRSGNDQEVTDVEPKEKPDTLDFLMAMSEEDFANFFSRVADLRDSAKSSSEVHVAEEEAPAVKEAVSEASATKPNSRKEKRKPVKDLSDLAEAMKAAKDSTNHEETE